MSTTASRTVAARLRAATAAGFIVASGPALVGCTTTAPTAPPSTGPSPTTIGSSPTTEASPAATRNECPDLTADLPGDLTQVKRVIEDDLPAPRTVRVFFENGAGDRYVSLVAAATDDVRGHGALEPAQPTTVAGTPGTIAASGDQREARLVVGDDASGGCGFWSVRSSGLTQAEFDSVVGSVKVAQ